MIFDIARGTVRAALFSLTILALTSRPSWAKSAGDYAIDARDYALAPLHWTERDWQWAAGAAAAVATAYSFDGRTRDHFVSGSVPAGTDPHQWRDAAPIAALTVGTFAVGLLRHDTESTRSGANMLEAVALGGLSSIVLKTVTGRERPNETADRSQFRSGGDGFPSAHVTMAFAAAQVFADSMPREQWGWRALGYGLAAATAYARLDSNVHWGSDIVAGASLGIATGRFVSGRGATSSKRVSMWLVPLDHGALLTVNVNQP